MILNYVIPTALVITIIILYIICYIQRNIIKRYEEKETYTRNYFTKNNVGYNKLF